MMSGAVIAEKRPVLLRILAAVFAATWIVLPGFGAIDLAVTWNRDWPQVLEAGWGLFATVVIGAPLALVAVRRDRLRPAVAQIAVAAGALAVSALASEEFRLLAFAVAAVAQAAVLVALEPESLRGDEHVARRTSLPLLALGAVGIVPWLVYALRMWAANRDDLPVDITVGVDHYAMQGALAVSLAALPLAAAVVPDLRRYVAICAGVSAFYLGLVSLAWPDAVGALTTSGAAAALAWGFALVVAPDVPRLRAASQPQVVAAAAFASAGAAWLAIWVHQRRAHGTTEINEQNVVAGLTWMDSGKVLVVPLALFLIALVALHRAAGVMVRRQTIAIAVAAIATTALAAGIALQFWSFAWGSYDEGFERAAPRFGGVVQALAVPVLGVSLVALAVALVRVHALTAWAAPALPVSAFAMFWSTPTSPLPAIAWLSLAAVGVVQVGSHPSWYADRSSSPKRA